MPRMGRYPGLLFLLLMNAAYAQEPLPAATNPADEFSTAIEDNSFFIEEAYNQDPRVVQHIASMTYFSSPQKDAVISFTQEWPSDPRTTNSVSLSPTQA